MNAVIKACVEGWLSALRLPGYILLRWFVNLVIALLIVAPLAHILALDLDQSAFSLELLRDMDPRYPDELAARFEGQLSVLRDSSLWLYGLFILASIYLNGGILTALQSDQGRPPGRFFGLCTKHFPGMMVIALVSLIMAWAVIMIAVASSRLLAPLHLTGSPVLYAWTLLAVIGLMLFSWVARFYNSWRLLYTQPGGSGSVLKTFTKAFGFTVKYHKATFVVWTFYIGAHLALVLFFLWLIPRLNVTNIWLTLAMGQLLIIARIFTGLAHLGGMVTLLRENNGLTLAQSEKPTMAPQPEEPESPPKTDYPTEQDGESPFFQEHV